MQLNNCTKSTFLVQKKCCKYASVKLFYYFCRQISISFQEMIKDKAARLRAACVVYIYIIGAEFSEDSENSEIAEDKSHALRALI